MKNAERYRNQITQLTAQLTPSDRRYFDDLRLYLTTQNIFYNETILNLQLLSMLQDLLDANREGTSAEQFFRNDPQHMAQEIFAQLPKPRLRDHLSFLSLLVGISWFFLLLSGHQTSQGLVLNAVTFLTIPILFIVAIGLIMRILHDSVYNQSPTSAKLRAHLLIGSIFIVTVGLSILIEARAPAQFLVTIPAPWHLGLLGMLALLATGYFVRVLSQRLHSRR